MVDYREDIQVAEEFKKKFVDGLDELIFDRQRDFEKKRKEYRKDIMRTPEKYREAFKSMLGWPLVDHVDEGLPDVTSVMLAHENGYTIYRMTFRLLGTVDVTGLYFELDGNEKRPLVIAQHGGWGSPEQISNLYGDTENYNHMAERVLERGAHVFAPQLLLWNPNKHTTEYDRARIVSEIGRMQPEILTFCDPEWTPGVRWVGNEDGYASLNNPLVVSSTDYSELSTEEQKLSCAAFLPAECDCKLRSTWFWDENEDTIKSVDELFGMYEMSVGHGSNFLINIGPDARGLLPDADVKRILELRDRIKAAYGKPIPYSAPMRDGNVYTITAEALNAPDWKTNPDESRLVNRLAITEDLSNGQRIKSFSVYAYLPVYQKKKILLFEGRTVGHKVICPFGALRASKFEVVVNSASGDYTITDIKAYFAK
jgi:alpha-L-fucosidase